MNSRYQFAIITSSTALVVLLSVGAVIGRSASTEDAYRHLSVYTEVLSRIKSEYVEEPDVKNVTLGAMNGMLESIDPFASYLSAEQYKQYLKSHDVKKPGVGLVLSRKFGYVGVVNAMPGSSAAKAGLSTGDMLETINSVATRDMPLAYAEMLLSGESGSNVEVTALRLRRPEPQKLTLTRAATRYPGVTAKLLPDQVGLVQVQSLETGKLKEVTVAFEGLEKQGAKKFVLDLRNCSVGKPEDGAPIANLFLDKGSLTYLQGQKVPRQDFNADPGKLRFSHPMVVITNRGTAGAGEVATAALLDNKRAEVVGERTYGDAGLRRAISMDDGGAVILSVAKYYSPSGKAIQDTGVNPTVMMTEFEPAAESDEDTTPAPEAKKPEEDLLLKRAVEVLTKGKNPQAATGNPATSNPNEAPVPAPNKLPPTVIKEKK